MLLLQAHHQAKAGRPLVSHNLEGGQLTPRVIRRILPRAVHRIPLKIIHHIPLRITLRTPVDHKVPTHLAMVPMEVIRVQRTADGVATHPANGILEAETGIKVVHRGTKEAPLDKAKDLGSGDFLGN
ncbi:hypothetical protein AG1IA_07612 [Rhizoctonia solani AG-1 IA]|uniref:Uncharacterized protein n=1 Tax=Thanatephorus cucumeris (strain AG1-IA) TaxID=983506 RepID=L8WNN2_THACA|nr:hypothetical protein AG1IA_07612 [Rhizoctonia solani AG-1 IA]